MTILTGFPLKLLEQSATERLAYFENYTVAHPRLKEVYETLVRTIAEPAGASFIFVYGPSGIGKTTLRLRVEQKLTELALPKLESDRGCVPVVGVEAVAPESRNFNWKDYYTRALIALEEPLIDHKFNYGVRGIYRDIFGKINVEPKVVAPALRRALENALSYRHPDVFFIDEAQHFGAAFARMLEIPKNKVWMWQMGKVLPELNVILKICFTLQVSVLDFLTQETTKENSSQFSAMPQKQVIDSSRKKLEVKFDSDRTKQLLENVLQANEQPLPMTAVAKRLGYPKRVLYRHFPELCRAISAEYLKYMKESRIKRIEHCCQEVKQAVRQVHTEGIYPSEAAISRLLAKPGCFRDKKVRAALKAARREICLEP